MPALRVQIPQVVRLLDIRFTERGLEDGLAGIYLVFEYCQHDLAGILEWKNRDLALSEVKCVAHQLLSGLSHLHTYCSVL